jgi:hypothetical protein
MLSVAQPASLRRYARAQARRDLHEREWEWAATAKITTNDRQAIWFSNRTSHQCHGTIAPAAFAFALFARRTVLLWLLLRRLYFLFIGPSPWGLAAPPPPPHSLSLAIGLLPLGAWRRASTQPCRSGADKWLPTGQGLARSAPSGKFSGYFDAVCLIPCCSFEISLPRSALRAQPAVGGARFARTATGLPRSHIAVVFSGWASTRRRCYPHHA